MSARGYFTFVLHSHIPYVREAGRWPFGEETLHEAIAETYIPLLNALYDLKAEGVAPCLTIGLTPILLEQLADPTVLAHFELYLQEKLALVRLDIAQHQANRDEALLSLALFYERWYEGILNSFVDGYGRDLVGAFRKLREDTDLDVLTSAATHGYLPLMERDSTIYGQLATGRRASERRLGRLPTGIWLPECGYRPGYIKEGAQPYVKPGVESFLAGLNLQYFFTETTVITGGELLGKAAGDVIGPYGAVPLRKLAVVPISEPTEKTTFRPYYVGNSDVAVFGRDLRTGMQVWSAAHGYPGDFLYREFHRKHHQSGLQYWRITGTGVGLGDKDLYDPQKAQAQVRMHAAHFVGLVRAELAEFASRHETPGIIVSTYDTELFGHWWFEGVDWMKEVLRGLAADPAVELSNAADYIESFPPTEVMSIPESSWGSGGGHWTWDNPDTQWLWPLIHNAERRMEKLVERFPDASGEQLQLLNQVARELLLLESSDWPFLITTGQARDYAGNRFQGHLARFSQLAAMAEAGGPHNAAQIQALRVISELDNPFPTIDYRDFAEREGRS